VSIPSGAPPINEQILITSSVIQESHRTFVPAASNIRPSVILEQAITSIVYTYVAIRSTTRCGFGKITKPIRWNANLGLLFGLGGALAFGGYTCLSHLALRLVLARNGSLPLLLVPFLDYCVERIFLRRVGGGYIFIHRMLMEHFASLHGKPVDD
jgi:hypothetical protein